jgi:hypothetical protein
MKKDVLAQIQKAKDLVNMKKDSAKKMGESGWK